MSYCCSAIVNMTAFVAAAVPTAVKGPVETAPTPAPVSATVAVMWPPEEPVVAARFVTDAGME
jgi:hypothetical protein